MFGLVPEDLHSEKSSKTAEKCRKQQESLFGDPPFALFGFGFVGSVKHESDKGHNRVKYKKNFHSYIIIVEMKNSNRHYNHFFKHAAAVLCVAAMMLMPACSIFDDEDITGEPSESVTGFAPPATEESSTESSLPEDDTGFDRISKAYVYSAWYDVEKDNPVDYTSIDSNDAYALKCVFYFSEPVTGSFRVILKKDGKQVAVKDIRIKEKVVCECDFSAGLEGIGTFETGIYNVALETEGMSVAVSGDMRIN